MQDHNRTNSRSRSLPKTPLQEAVDTVDEGTASTSRQGPLPEFDPRSNEFDSVPLVFPANSFTPNNGQELSLFQATTGSFAHSDSVLIVDEQLHNRSPENLTSRRQTQGPKRNITTHEESRDAKRLRCQPPLPATPSSSPFQTLRVTKARGLGSDISFFKPVEENTNGRDGFQDHAIGPQFPPGWTVVDPLTPYPTRRRRESSDRFSDDPTVVLAIDSDATDAANLPVSSLNAIDDIDLGDEYPLDDDLMEEDMTCLLDIAVENIRETHIPPSSVTQAWDHDSRSAVEYDPTLQYSSPFSSGNMKGSQSMNTTEGLYSSEEDLLDDDVDWNAIYAMTKTIPRNSSAASPHDITHSLSTGQSTHMEKPIELEQHAEETIPLKPFIRPPFPEKIRDRSTVSGLSSDTVLRTCFRIGDMVNQAVHCLSHRQEAVFELFARVNYSSREGLQRRQHFQFIDLFKDQRPYPAGVLTNWRVGSQLDRQSSVFLNVSVEPRICRCVCKTIRDPKTAIGLSLLVLAIRESDWMQIKWAKQIVCGGPDAATLGLLPLRD